MCLSHSILCQNLLQKTKNSGGKGQFVSVLFIIPVIIDVHRHRFEIYTLVSEIHENVDQYWGIKNVFKLDRVINSQDLLQISEQIPTHHSKECVVSKPKEQKMIKEKAPFIDEIQV